MIEFNKCVVGGRSYIAVTSDNKTLAMLEKDGSSLVTYGARISFEHTEAILTKMKELQDTACNMQGSL